MSASALTPEAQPLSTLTRAQAQTLLESVCEQAERKPTPTGERVLLEFVSANPHNPLSAAHGRGGVIGDSLAALLSHTGNTVTREFYVNDATNSRQMRLFGRAVVGAWRRETGNDDYAARVARELKVTRAFAYLSALPPSEAETKAGDIAAKHIRTDQEIDLDRLGVRFDQFFFEGSLHTRGVVQTTLNRLRDAGHAYEKNAALWLRSTAFGDEADRVLLREDGTPTYLAGDLAYHADKFERGFDRLIDVWDTDHAGYIERTRAGLAALGYDPARLHVVLHGPVRVLKDGTELKAGQTVTLEELLNEAPRDTLRLLLLLASPSASVDIDVDRARRQDSANPLWLIQRTCEHAEKEAQSTSVAVTDNAAPAFEVVAALQNCVRAANEAARVLSPALLATAALQTARNYERYGAACAGQTWPLLGRATASTLRLALRLLINPSPDKVNP